MRIEETRTVAIARPLPWKLVGDPAVSGPIVAGHLRQTLRALAPNP